jgi:acetylglutamate kinase
MIKISYLPPKQTRRYLAALQSAPPHRQLLIKVGGGLLADKAETLELVAALAELDGQGVHVLLVHGGGPQLTEAIKKDGHETRFVKGVRYTDETTLRLAKSVFTNITNNLVQTLNNNGVKAAALQSARVLGAKRDEELGLCGKEVTAVGTEDIAAAMKDNSVLIMNSLARDADGGDTLNVNSDTVFRALASELKPLRMVSLTQTGGVFGPVKGTNARELLSGVDVRNIDALVEDGIVDGGMALKLRELASVLDGLETGSAISITKPSELLAELLTDQGSGTFVCKGQKIIRTDGLDDLYDDFAAMIKDTFKKSLPDGYRKQRFDKVYFTPDHLAFGIITKLSDGMPYLDKLAVSPELQGRGVGESLWYCVAKDYPRIVWRSHINNRYATWYHRHADIMKRSGEWILFGRGVEFSELEALEDELVSVPHMS